MRIFDRLLTYLYITFPGLSGIMARPIGCKSIVSTCNTNSIEMIHSPSQYYELLGTWMKFQGFAIWLYEPPQSDLFALSIPIDHTICFHEGNSASNVIFCTRTNVTGAYSTHNNSKALVEIFFKNSPQIREHQIRALIITTTDKLDSFHGNRLSYSTYTTECSTSSHLNLTSLFTSKSTHPSLLCTIRPSLPCNPGERIFWNLQVYRRPPVYGGFPISRPPPPSSFVIWVQALLVFWIALGFSLKCIEVAPEHREQRRLLYHVHRYRNYNGNPERARNDSTRTAPPSYTRPPSYYVPENEAGVLRDDILGGSNGPPPYTDIIREQSQVR